MKSRSQKNVDFNKESIKAIINKGQVDNMHKYRTYTCNELDLANVGEQVKLSGL